MPPLRSIAGFVAILAALSVHAVSQGAAAAPQAPKPSPAAPAAVSVPFLHTGANLVLLDVVIDNRDKVIRGLGKEHFHILQDGREQPLTVFEEHTASSAPVSAHLPELPPHTFTNVPVSAEAPAVNVLLLDALNTPTEDQMYMRQQMLGYLAKVRPGAPFAIFTLASRLRLVTGFTTDVSEIVKAMTSSRTSPQTSPLLAPAMGDSANALSDQLAATIPGATDTPSASALTDAVTSLQQFEADTAAFQTDLRVRMTLDAMQQLARYLSAIPGRKNLIWFSGSFPLALDPDETLRSPFQAMRNYADDVQKASRLLAAARVAVYPVDDRGLMTSPTFQATYRLSANPAAARNGGSFARDTMKFSQQTYNEHASMQQIAEQTGGKEYIDTNGLKEAVADAVENGSNYYTVGYIPANLKLDGQFHKLQVRVDGANYKLSYRRGFYADSSDKPSQGSLAQPSLIAASLLHSMPSASQIRFQARILPASDPAFQNLKQSDGPAGEMSASLKPPAHRYILDLNLQATDFAYRELADNIHQAAVEIAVVAYDDEGKPLNRFDRGFRIALPPSQYAAVLSKGIPVRAALDLPAGHAFLRFAIYDMETARVGTLEVPIAVAAK